MGKSKTFLVLWKLHTVEVWALPLNQTWEGKIVATHGSFNFTATQIWTDEEGLK